MCLSIQTDLVDGCTLSDSQINEDGSHFGRIAYMYDGFCFWNIVNKSNTQDE